MVFRAQAEDLQSTGEAGPLQQLTEWVLESALEGVITGHLGHDEHDPAGKNSGDSRKGTRAKTVLTDVGPVETAVPRDRDGSFEGARPVGAECPQGEVLPSGGGVVAAVSVGAFEGNAPARVPFLDDEVHAVGVLQFDVQPRRHGSGESGVHRDRPAGRGS